MIEAKTIMIPKGQSLERDSISHEKTGYELLQSDIKEIPFLVAPILQEVGLASIAGSSDVGKSSLLRKLAIDICLGKSEFLDFEIRSKHRSVIYVSTEDDLLAVSYMLNLSNQERKIPEEEYTGLRYIFNTDELLINLDKSLSTKPADLVIIDAFTDLYGKSMNESNQVRTFLNDFNQLAQKHQCLFLFLHHTGKRTENEVPSKNNLLGSQAFEAKMRLVVELRNDLHDDQLKHFCIVKGNYLKAEYKKESYVLRFNEFLNFKYTGERVPFEQLAKPIGQAYADKKELAIKLHEEGKSFQNIADEVGISKSTAHKYVKRSQGTNANEQTNKDE